MQADLTTQHTFSVCILGQADVTITVSVRDLAESRARMAEEGTVLHIPSLGIRAGAEIIEHLSQYLQEEYGGTQ